MVSLAQQEPALRMPEGKTLEVTVMALALPIGYGRPRPRARSRSDAERASRGALACATLALHALAALALIVSTRTLELPVRRGAAGDFEQGLREATPLITTFIESRADAPGELVSLAPAPSEWTTPPLAAALPLPAPEDLERLATVDEAATAAFGLEESERLRGIYRAQLEARIERAWERPYLLEAGLTFSCTVTLSGLTAPEGPGMDFSACEASAALRATLATAIRRALPLPAPPSALALPRSLTLEFAAH